MALRDLKVLQASTARLVLPVTTELTGHRVPPESTERWARRVLRAIPEFRDTTEPTALLVLRARLALTARSVLRVLRVTRAFRGTTARMGSRASKVLPASTVLREFRVPPVFPALPRSCPPILTT